MYGYILFIYLKGVSVCEYSSQKWWVCYFEALLGVENPRAVRVDYWNDGITEHVFRLSYFFEDEFRYLISYIEFDGFHEFVVDANVVEF